MSTIFVSLVLSTSLFATTCIVGKKLKVHQVCGQVVDKDGAVVAEAFVFLKSLGGAETVATISTDQEGNFQFSDLKSGEYELRVKLDGFWDASQPFILSSPRRSQACKERLKVVMNLAGSCSYVEKFKHNAQTY
jgi:hypothetical protein